MGSPYRLLAPLIRLFSWRKSHEIDGFTGNSRVVPVACTSKGGEAMQRSASGPEKVSAQSGQKHDPCSLVTKEEMSQVTGEQFTDASAEKNSKTCIYMSADPSVASAVISSTWDGEESRAMIPAMKIGEDLTKMTPGGEAMIPGLGDQASFATYALTVRKGDAAFMI